MDCVTRDRQKDRGCSRSHRTRGYRRSRLRLSVPVPPSTTNWTSPSCGGTAPAGIGFARLTVDSYGNLYGIGTDANVYYCGEALSATVWTKLALPSNRTALDISTAGAMRTWAALLVIPGTAYLYRLSEHGLQFSGTLSGSGVCSGGGWPQSCPVTHSGYNQVGWRGRSASVTTGSSSATLDASGGSFSTTTTSTLLDAFDCFESSPNCTPTASQQVNCSAMGTIYTNNWSMGMPTLMINRVTHRKTGPGRSCWTGPRPTNIRYCWYPVTPHCPNPGPYSFVDTEVKDAQAVGDRVWGWLVYADCIYFPQGGKLCLPGVGVELMADPYKVCDTR